MKNYIMIDGKQIDISDETANNLRKQFCKTPKEVLLEKYDGYRLPGYASLTRTKDGVIIIPLPNANIDWTFAAWDLAKQICKEGKEMGLWPYPCHDHSLSTAKNITIKVDNV